MRPFKHDLGRFLRSRRASLRLDGTVIAPFAKVRHGSGLRGEQVALLAGVSTNYYARLESGESHQMSDSIFEGIVSALQLDRYERQYLALLTRPAHVSSRDHGAERAHAAIDAGRLQAGGLLGRRTDLLGANRLFRVLYGFRSGQRVNMALHLFLEPTMRDLLLDWEGAATDAVAHLRAAFGARPGDPALNTLIGELSRKSPEFARIWAAHPALDDAFTVQQFNHPQVGRLTLLMETEDVPDHPGHRMHLLTAPEDSDSAERLRLLSSLAG
nr:helix-turn-helix transcriptional regulator [uncultured Actinoplanes sp.]